MFKGKGYLTQVVYDFILYSFVVHKSTSFKIKLDVIASMKLFSIFPMSVLYFTSLNLLSNLYYSSLYP